MIINLNTYRNSRSKEAELAFYNSELKSNIIKRHKIDTDIAVIEDIIQIIEKEIEEDQE